MSQKSADEIAGEAYQVISTLLDLCPAFAVTPQALGLLDYFSRDWKVPGKEILPFDIPPLQPPPGLLMSMALRYDHGLGMPGYYDQELFTGSGITHKQRLEGALVTMKQLWEEASGNGFYKSKQEVQYAAQLEQLLKGPDKT